MHFDWTKIVGPLLHANFIYLHRLVDELEPSLVAAAQKVGERLEADLAKAGDDEDAQQWWQDAAADEGHAVEIATQLGRRAVLLIAYGVFEHGLRRICMAAHKNALGGVPKKVKYLEHAEAYLHQVGVPGAIFDADWDFADALRNVRNFLAHADGQLDDSPSAGSARAFIAAQGPALLLEDDHSRIEIKGAFTRRAVEALERCTEKLLAAVAR